MIPFFDLKKQISELRVDIDSNVASVLENGNFILGSCVSKFEKEFSSYCGVSDGVGVGSGTYAIILALMLNGIKGEVLVPSHTAIPTVNAIVNAGCSPVFVDIDETYTMDCDDAESKITDKTEAILPVHLYGQPADMKRVVEIVDSSDLRLVEDCCQAHGAEINGKRVGSFGIGCFSFYPTKNLGCFGDGGMVVGNDIEGVRKLRQYGWNIDKISQVVGVNSRLDELQAAILSLKLKYLDKWTGRRIEIATRYNKELNVQVPFVADGRKHVYHLYVIQVDGRKEFISKLSGRGIGTSIHYPLPVHKHPAFTQAIELPVTDKISGRIVSLPMFPELADEEQTKVIDAVNKVVK